jgi:P-type Cu2+ transporter
VEVAMLTGDSRAVANAVARELDIDFVIAEVMPEDKADKIKELQQQDKRVSTVIVAINAQLLRRVEL